MRIDRRLSLGLLLALLTGIALPGSAQAAAPGFLSSCLQGKRKKKPKIKASVHYARSWEAAVGEAKMLKLPLVVHIHGFN